MTVRIGQGFDAHRFTSGNSIILGGVSIPFDKGLQAHSDGDIVIHALCDALLGAMGQGDIGRYFPDSSESYEDIDSRILLRKIVTMMQESNYRLGNMDITIIAQAPRLAPYIQEMQLKLSEDLNVSVTEVNIKATTTEGMGFTGRGEGIAVQAVVVLCEV